MQKNDQAPRRKRDPIVAPPLNWVAAPAKPDVSIKQTFQENDSSATAGVKSS